MKDGITTTDGVSRRRLLKVGAVGAGALSLGSTTAAASDHDDEKADDHDENGNGNGEVDEPEGFEVEILVEHTPFRDDVAARFCVDYADTDDGDTEVVDLEDASSVITAQVHWDERARSGWHRHPGMSIVTMVEGEIEHTMEDDCVPRTYSAGDAWIDPGHVHKADSEGGAEAYITFLGIPEGEPATEWVEPREC
ncbi:MAG: hypothetical protein QXG03_09755 [Halalkalicoccus sp.]